VKIFDFGVARMRRQQITREGQQLGTPLYMSPEQVRGEQVTFATDVYSYGVLLFVMFSGAFPYRAVSREDLYAAIVFYPPDMTSLDNKGIPPQIVNLIGQCLQKQAAARPATFREIESRLRPMAAPEVAGTGTSQFGALDVTAPVPVMVLKPKRRKSRGWLWAVLVVVAVSGGAAGYWYLNRPRVLEPRISAKGGFMVLVPAGPGFVGKERRAVDLPDFYIDRAEVSDEWYREFANSTGRADATPDAPASFPVVNVAYDDAAAFCAWAGKRLPTDVEWEKAARGPKGLAFPWGDQFRPDLANIPFEDQTRTLEPVESNLKGASHYGAINLVGNVWEWVAKQEELNTGDLRDLVLDPPATVGERAFQIRGGSFQNRIDLHRAVWDFAVAPARLKRSDVGFRCARLP
jgi:serine/threonine-protein kinase